MNTIPNLQISSVQRLRRFVSQRQAAQSNSLVRKPAIRLTVAGMLPAMKHWGIVRAGLDPMDIPKRPANQPKSEQNFEGPPTSSASSIRSEPTRTTEFFRSLLNGMVTKPAASKPGEQKTTSSISAPKSELPSRGKNLTQTVPHLQRLVERASRGPAQSLPTGLRDFLGGRLKKWLPSVQIHQGPAAEELTSVMRADAVTFGNRIAFRHGRYQPDRPEGVALLGHELAHVAHASSSPTMSPAADERAALTHEHQIFNELSRPRAIHRTPLTLTSPTPLADAGSVRTAHENRTLPAIASGESEPITERQLADLKDQVYRDLLQRLRTDFERGS